MEDISWTEREIRTFFLDVSTDELRRIHEVVGELIRERRRPLVASAHLQAYQFEDKL
jgi:hypothetical protein